MTPPRLGLCLLALIAVASAQAPAPRKSKAASGFIRASGNK
jgi:hypothetical protein